MIAAAPNISDTKNRLAKALMIPYMKYDPLIPLEAAGLAIGEVAAKYATELAIEWAELQWVVVVVERSHTCCRWCHPQQLVHRILDN